MMRESLTFSMLTKRVRTALASVLTTAALACLLCGAALAENADPTPTPEPTELDLRGRALTVEQFEAQREAHPDIPIYWDVPIAGRRIDSQSRAITVPDYTARDRAALDYFPDLESVDASGSTDIEALTELYRCAGASPLVTSFIPPGRLCCSWKVRWISARWRKSWPGSRR